MHDINQLCEASPDASQLRSLLKKLFAEQLQLTPIEYFRYHSSDQAIASHVNSFLEYRDFLPTAGRILDWGCHHAPDACMVRAVSVPNKVSLVGCDWMEANQYPVFWNYSGMEYLRLTHHVDLPLKDNSFDCVIGSGVLEHTAMDYESLKELYRILKPYGTLIITHLPNKFSYTEFIAREFRKCDFHQRLYTVASISSMLKHAGFHPQKIRRHRLLPTNSLQSITRFLSPYERLIERVWPFSLVCGDILVVAKKVPSM